MDIKIIKEMKAQCESKIKVILVMFQEQTGTSIEELEISKDYFMDGKTEIVNVSMDVRIG